MTTKELREITEDQRCRVCGCGQYQPCVVANVPCFWVEEDLCSMCRYEGKN